ncbi:MAG: CNNM domain-containing protein [Treponema sp.]
MNSIFTFVILIILIILVGFFTSSETAYLSLPKLKVRSMVEERKPYAKIIAKLKSNMDKLLTTVLIGTNFLNSLASAIATALAIEFLGAKGSAIAPFATAFFITVFGQIMPKTVASLYPENMASFSSVPLSILEKIFFPIIWLFERLSHCVVFFAEKLIKNDGSIVTEEELKTLIDVGSNEGTIEKDESELLNKIIKFNNLSINDVMKHRSVVSMISVDATYKEVEQEFLKSGFSTLTVYSGYKENVVGVLNYKKLLFDSHNEDLEKGYAKRKMSQVMFVPGTLSLFEVLQKFRQDEHKFAVVLDEQGQTQGIITIEDIMKLVFKNMSDENSYDDKPAEDKIEPISYNTFIVQGDMKIEDVNEILGLKLESEEMNTVGGWLLEQFGYLPSEQNVFVKDNNVFTVEEIFQRRIRKIKIKKC